MKLLWLFFLSIVQFTSSRAVNSELQISCKCKVRLMFLKYRFNKNENSNQFVDVQLDDLDMYIRYIFLHCISKILGIFGFSSIMSHPLQICQAQKYKSILLKPFKFGSQGILNKGSGVLLFFTLAFHWVATWVVVLYYLAQFLHAS